MERPLTSVPVVLRRVAAVAVVPAIECSVAPIDYGLPAPTRLERVYLVVKSGRMSRQQVLVSQW